MGVQNLLAVRLEYRQLLSGQVFRDEFRGHLLLKLDASDMADSAGCRFGVYEVPRMGFLMSYKCGGI